MHPLDVLNGIAGSSRCSSTPLRPVDQRGRSSQRVPPLLLLFLFLELADEPDHPGGDQHAGDPEPEHSCGSSAEYCSYDLPRAFVTRLCPHQGAVENLEGLQLLPSRLGLFRCRAAADRYSALRREILAGQVSLPSFRFPQPLPIQNQSWEPVMLPDGRPAVKVRVGAYYWTLRLRGGPMFKRQLAGLQAMLDNTARRGDLVFYEKRAHGGDHRPSGALGPTGRTSKTRLMVKLVGTFPKREDKGPRQGVLTVSTKADVLYDWKIDGGMTGRLDGRYHPEWVRSWVGGHRQRLQKWSDTLKPEHRFPVAERKRLVSDHEATLAKHRNRMKSFVQQAAAMLAGLADRRRVAKVVYDDTDKAYAELPWYELRERLKVFLNERGIQAEFTADREEVT